jgi:hypothetical protein
MSGHVEPNPSSITTELSYLVKDPKFEHEKPYTLKYGTEGALPRTNTVNEARSVSVRNFRALQNQHSFEEYGFTSITIDCSLAPVEYNNRNRVKQKYYPAVIKVLWQMYPDASRVEILEHGVCTPRRFSNCRAYHCM